VSRPTRGWTVVDLMMGLIMAAILLTALYKLFLANVTGQAEVFDVTWSSSAARQPRETLADHLRIAQSCSASSGCIQNSVLAAGAATDITYYTDAAGSTVRYYLSGTNLVRVVNGVPTTVLQNINSLSLTYYTSTTYNSASLTATASPSAPTAAELPSLAAVKITASSTTDGHTVQYSTLVRLCNSPIRTNLKGN